jgi:hypothetical protein
LAFIKVPDVGTYFQGDDESEPEDKFEEVSPASDVEGAIVGAAEARQWRDDRWPGKTWRAWVSDGLSKAA